MWKRKELWFSLFSRELKFSFFEFFRFVVVVDDETTKKNVGEKEKRESAFFCSLKRVFRV